MALKDMVTEISSLNRFKALVSIIPVYANKHAKSEVSALLLCDGVYKSLIELNKLPKAFADFLLDVNRVFLFYDAKPLFKLLLKYKLDASRLMCLKTINEVLGNPPLDTNVLASSVEEAVVWADHALSEIKNLWGDIEKQRPLLRLENLVLRVFASMEFNGMYVDRFAWENIINDANLQLVHVKATTLNAFKTTDNVDLFGDCTINLDSGKEVKLALEKMVGYEIADTHSSTLKEINHPAAKSLLEYREIAKLVQTYGENFLQCIDIKSNRIHANFEPIGSLSGRATCNNPNLQNLPSSEKFHKCVVSPPGKILITADYAGCELRILAGLSRDQTFLDAFAKDADVHSEIATRMFGVHVDKNNNAHLRQRAKTINFGLMYGMGARTLGRNLQITDEESEQLFEQYFKTYPQVKIYLDECVNKAFANGYVETVLGRKLIFSKEQLYNKEAGSEVSRLAKNMPIQGTGAEIIKLAMVRIHERLLAEFKEAFIVNMIHDELVVECLMEDGADVAILVQVEMESAQNILVPAVKPKADVYTGFYWKH